MKQWTDIIREVFPRADILDAALSYPIGEQGWAVDVTPARFDFADPDYHLFINLQDMLTGSELTDLLTHFRDMNADLSRITVLCWPMDVQLSMPEDSFNIVTFSSHQYETWCTYKQSESVLREAFSPDKKTVEYSWVCPQRIYKPHRAVLFSKLKQFSHGNISLQSKGSELHYPSLSYAEYDSSYDNLTNLLAMKKNYNTAVFSIVSESQFEQQYGIITEKTFNSIVAGLPFVVCGHRGAVDQIKRLGFDTYNTFFDHSYDDVDNSVRIKFMIELNRKLIKNKLSSVEKQMIYEELSDRIEFNRTYFFEQFGDQLIDNLRRDLLNLWS